MAKAKAKMASFEYDREPEGGPLPGQAAIADELDAPSASYQETEPHWKPIKALLGGTPEMRRLAREWLPQEPREKDPSYVLRLQRSFLYGFFKDTVEKIVAKPFSKPVVLKPEGDDLVEPLDVLEKDADRQGHDMTTFARLLFREAVQYGSAYVIVDVPLPPTDLPPGSERRLDVQRERDLRPYWTLVSAPNMIDVQTDDMGNVIEARVCEWIPVRKRYKDENVKHVRLWKAAGVEEDENGNLVAHPAGWWLYRKEKGQWLKVDEGQINYPGPGLPFVSLILEPTGPMAGCPPLADLAWLNIAHWQSFSDYRNILRFVSTGILFGKGIAKTEIGGGVTLAGNRGIFTLNQDASLQWVEHGGQALGALRESIQDLEGRAEVLGLQPFLTQTGNYTATARAIDESKTESSIQAWARSLEHALEECYHVSARWVKRELPEDFAVDVFNDFGVSMRAQADILALIQMRTAKQIDHKTFLEELRRRALLSDAASADEIMDRLAQEGPPPGRVGLDAGFQSLFGGFGGAATNGAQQ